MSDKPQRPSLYDPDVDVSTERNTGIGKLEKYINYARKLETYINYLEDERIAELEEKIERLHHAMANEGLWQYIHEEEK